jgi:hypothetical protein
VRATKVTHIGGVSSVRYGSKNKHHLHHVVLQALFAYFLDIEVEEIPFMDIDMNTVYQFTSRAYGTEVQTFKVK